MVSFSQDGGHAQPWFAFDLDEHIPEGGLFARTLIAHMAPTQVLGLAVLLVLAGFFLRRYGSHRQRRLGRAMAFLCLSVFLVTASATLDLGGMHALSARLDVLAATMRIFTLIAIVWPVVFDLFFARLAIDVPGIAQELTAGLCYAAACVGLFHAWGFNIWSLVATSAVATAVLGLSLQPTLGNLVGGITLQIDGSMREGDWVRLKDGSLAGLEGRVQEIRWRYTVIETRSGDAAIVPNSTLMQQPFLLLGRRADATYPHRMEVPFDVTLTASPTVVIEAVSGALRMSPMPYVAHEPQPDCICLGFGADYHAGMARYAARYWLTNLAEDGPTSSAVLGRIHVALARAGLALAVPMSEVAVTRLSARLRSERSAIENERRAGLLAQVALLSVLTPEERAGLAPRLKPAPFATGETITRQGSEAHWLYVLVQGSVEVFVSGAHGEAVQVGVIDAPGFFGEMSLMTGEPRASTVVARSAVECLRLDRNDFRELITRRPEIAESVAKVLAVRRIQLENALSGSAAHANDARIVDEGHRILARIREFFGLNHA